MNIKAFFFSSLPSECIYHFWPEQTVQRRWRRVSEKSESPEIGRYPFKLPELSSFQDKARIQQRGLTKSKKAT